MVEERTGIDGLIEAIKSKVFPFLEEEGFRLVPHRRFHEAGLQVQLSPQGLSVRGRARIKIGLNPKEDYCFYQWTPRSDTTLLTTSKDWGINIKSRTGEPILQDVAGYDITQINLDYRNE